MTSLIVNPESQTDLGEHFGTYFLLHFGVLVTIVHVLTFGSYFLFTLHMILEALVW